jgi:hypothetical protein
MVDDPEDFKVALVEARRAQAMYAEITRRIEKLQAKVKADETLVVLVQGVRISGVGVSGGTILFAGTDREWGEVSLLQHYSQVSLVIYRARLAKGEEPKRICFLGETE